MQIHCPTCATSYMIAPASLGAAGRTVRCSRCGTTWFAAAVVPPAAVAETIAEPAGTQAAAAPAPFHATGDFGPEPEAPVGEVPQAETAAAAETAPTIVVEAPPLVPPAGHEPLPGDAAAAAEAADIESFAARRERLQARRRSRQRTSRWAALFLLLFAGNVALIGARQEVVRYLPQTASLFSAIGLPVNLRQLNFENVRIARASEDGKPVLVVDGTIVSASAKPVEVPRLRFAARNPAGQEIYSWTMQPERKVLLPGETMSFRSRLVSPPKDVRDVLVRFFTAADATGAK
ncbi:MAG TPA: MJ0042-type zinc finger domain-containing protein [Pseudolabrys sp.]|nr:MJ0042-type zinc finger domain-containing protein [Pseudolabrys sp.]